MRRRLPVLPIAFLFALMTVMITVPFRFEAHASELDGVQVPDSLQANGKTLYLNGFGRRTYPILGIHIYVASLYLEHFSTNPDEIIRSQQTKLLAVRFERNVSAEEARDAWRKNLENSCMAPCRLNPEDVERFLSGIPAIYVGDIFHLLFEPDVATVTVNGQQIGTTRKRQFADAILATFLGPNTGLPRLRQELLTQRSFTDANLEVSNQRASGNRDR